MEFLLEINTEEMPLSHIQAGLSQLEENLEKELVQENIEISRIQTFGTCRRLIVWGDFGSFQADREEILMGPPKSVAFFPDGASSPAAKGFAKSQNTSVQKLEVVQTEKGEYMAVRKIIEGRPTPDILREILPSLISSLSFPKMMRWGDKTLRFSRPIKSILCLFDKKPVNISVNGIQSCDFTTGHRIFSPREIKILSFAEYKEALRKNHVIVEPEARRKMILKQIEKKLSPLNAQLLADGELLEKLTFDVEHPYVFLGTFPDEYLNLPLEILSTAMKKGQNLFSVVRKGKQLPYFVGVADGLKDSKSLIQKGNERVLKARLEDARFFWEQDLKTDLKKRSRQLDKVVFQEKLGTYADKTERLKKLAAYLAGKLDAKKEKKHAVAAAEICKADLVTEMVREFPSLQGRVGGLYAREEKFPEPLWKAVYEHYQPLGLEDESPSTLTGAILSIADKLDSLIGVMGLGIEITGSKDPFGIRRNAQGICKIILEKKLNFSFFRLLNKGLEVYENILEKPKDEVRKYCVEFFTNRIQYIFEREGYRYDLIKAALAPGIENIYFAYLRLRALDSLKDSSQFEPMILIAKRVNNILRGQPSYKINFSLLQEKKEKELFSTFSIVKEHALPLIAKGNFSEAQAIVFRLRSAINDFFDHVLVMTEDRKIQQNRLAMLQSISRLLMKIGDYSQIVVEG